jgi:hypothetical protein
MKQAFKHFQLLACTLLLATLTTTPAQAQNNAINPFTGLPTNNTQRPILIKVSNEAAVRPQTGLSLADVVIEGYAEGNILRLNALYQTNLPEKVGSVRSCRLIDMELPVIFDSGLLCSGTSSGTLQRIVKSAAYLDDRMMINNNGAFQYANGPLYRTRDARVPHNLFGSAPKAMAVLQQRGKNGPTAFNTWRFDGAAPSGGSPLNVVTLPYSSGRVGWAYNAGTSLWNRSMLGRPHTDRLNGKQLASANVVVVYVHHQLTDIREDSLGSRGIEIQLWGEGAAKFFRDGQVWDGKWSRPGSGIGLNFTDANGQPIPLKPGNTWIELVPIGFNIVVQ